LFAQRLDETPLETFLQLLGQPLTQRAHHRRNMLLSILLSTTKSITLASLIVSIQLHQVLLAARFGHLKIGKEGKGGERRGKEGKKRKGRRGGVRGEEEV
jgi:hypothetical protein